ncbi:MAG: hypothetical protein QXT74_05365 [Candidatus Nezhaarchaeales archaeon]
MPLTILCSRCGFILQRIEAEDPILSAKRSLLADVSRRYGSKCPNCSKLLSLKPEAIEVGPAGSPLLRPSLLDSRPSRMRGTRVLPLMKFS